MTTKLGTYFMEYIEYVGWIHRGFTHHVPWFMKLHIDSLVQDCSNSSVLAMELLQSWNKPSIYAYMFIRSESAMKKWMWGVVLY